MIIRNIVLSALMVVTLITCMGCVPIVIVGSVGAAATLTMAATEERGLRGVCSDVAIRTKINIKWADYDQRLIELVELQVREGCVLLSGTVEKYEQQIDAINLVWLVDGVREVIDEIRVGRESGIIGYTSDIWITAKIKTRLFFGNKIKSNNYNVKTIKGSVFLMGISQNKDELMSATEIIRNVDGVKCIISYLRVKRDPIPHL